MKRRNLVFSKNLTYYRLKKGLNKKELAKQAGVTPASITHYEKGERVPESMDVIKKLALALEVKVTDFMVFHTGDLVFSFGDFRKNQSLSKSDQELVRAQTERYFTRFFNVIEVLGESCLPSSPELSVLPLSENVEENAEAMRRYLGLSLTGPVGNLTCCLENRGFLVFAYDPELCDFFGMNGTVNGRPFIVCNGAHAPERTRLTIARELARILFFWPEGMEDKEAEKLVTATGGAFLFPKTDVIRELGPRRASLTMKELNIVGEEYGISPSLIVKRAEICHVLSKERAKRIYQVLAQKGWFSGKQPERINREKSELFEQLVFRAVSDDEISIQKGGELLNKPCEYIAEQCIPIQDSE